MSPPAAGSIGWPLSVPTPESLTTSLVVGPLYRTRVYRRLKVAIRDPARLKRYHNSPTINFRYGTLRVSPLKLTQTQIRYSQEMKTTASRPSPLQ
jgi:hypothetical protein